MMNAKTFTRIHLAQARSGLSLSTYCRQQGIPLSTFHSWRKRYGAAPAAHEGFLEVRLDPLSDTAAACFQSSKPSLQITFRGTTLILPEHFSQASFRQCLETLKEILPC